jgi:hypothetical protein
MRAIGRWNSIPNHRSSLGILALQTAFCLFAADRVFSAPAAASPRPSDPVIRKAPTWHPPQVAEIKVQLAGWLTKNVADSAQRAKALALVGSLGDQATGAELLDRLGEVFALADPRVAKLVETCSRPRSSTVLPTFSWLNDSKTSPLLAMNMRLYLGRWLIQGQWHEEALEQIGSLKTADVVAPAELLFYQGVCYHSLLNKEEGLKVINQLLDGAAESPQGVPCCPRRYVAVAYLMQADLNSLEKDTLDEIARRMKIVGTKLDQGRAGPKVRKAEDDVVDLLNKMIKKIEEEQDKNQGPSNNLQSSNPARDSVPSGGKAPGEVTKKDIGHKSGWGDLPPKEREEALQQMGRDFPPHYRDAIEEYFRKLAAEESTGDDE